MIDLGIYTVMVINIYIVKKIFKTKVNSPRKIGKGVRQGCILSPCLFNLYAQGVAVSAGEYQADERAGVARLACEYQADERAGVARLSWRVSGR